MAGFNNITQMRAELFSLGMQESKHLPEYRVIQAYNIWVLNPNRFTYLEESRNFRPRGTRILSGPYAGKFPTTTKEKR